jgi:hypothetical protein
MPLGGGMHLCFDDAKLMFGKHELLYYPNDATLLFAIWPGANLVSAIARLHSPRLLLPEPKGVAAADVIAELVEALERAGRLTDRASFLMRFWPARR